MFLPSSFDFSFSHFAFISLSPSNEDDGQVHSQIVRPKNEV